MVFLAIVKKQFLDFLFYIKMLMQSILKSFGYAYFDVRSVMLDSYLKIWLGTAGKARNKNNCNLK